MILMGIYKITNIENHRLYVGSAINLGIREKQHFWYLKNNIHQNTFLQNDYNKHGQEKFIFEILEYIFDANGLIITEQKYLDKYFDNTKQCYNICQIAKSRFGTKHSDKTKEKMSASWTISRKQDLIKRSQKNGLYNLTGHKNPFFGKKHTEQTKAKIALSKVNKELSLDTINKIKETFVKKYGGSPTKGKIKTQAEKQIDRLAQKTRKQILAINVITNENIKFASIREASENLNLKARHQITAILKNPFRKNGKFRLYKNWRFEYDKQ